MRFRADRHRVLPMFIGFPSYEGLGLSVSLEVIEHQEAENTFRDRSSARLVYL